MTFTGRFGVPLHEPEIVDGERPAPLDLPGADRTADRVRGHIERLQQALEPGLVLDDLEHLGERHQAHARQLLGDERIEVVAPQFAVGDDVAAEGVLEPHQIDHSGVGDAIELGAIDPLPAKLPERLGDRGRPRPAADGGHRKQWQLTRHRWRARKSALLQRRR